MKRILLVMVIAVVAAAAAGAAWLYASLPKTGGEIALPSAQLSQRVEIRRDGYGVPHIRAASLRDGLFGLGFVHAQDRMFQMEMTRRSGAGRLAESFGAAAVPGDRYMRTLGLYRLAQQQYEALDEPTRQALQAYADGVNAWIANRRGVLPPEFLVLWSEPEPWKPADSLVWGKMMAVYLSSNWRDEVQRLRLLESVPREIVDALWPRQPATAAGTAQDLPPIPADVLAGLVAAHPVPPGTPAGASNGWTVSGSRTSTGKPLLANDPHLGFQVPILWYLARLETSGQRWAGATVPGVPFIIVGHNERVAWGSTTTQADVEDLFVERLDAADPGRYLTPEGPRPFEVRREVIHVRDGEDVTLDVRSTRHGVVVSDLAGTPAVGSDAVLALAAPYLRADDETPGSLYDINVARGCGDFMQALRRFHSPQQTMLCADVEGNTSYMAAGRIPVRASGDGRYPQPGWTGASDWAGFIPYEELPQGANPADGIIVAANHRKAPLDYRYELGDEFAPPYRADRIRALLVTENGQRREGMARIQLDSVSPMAREFLPAMTAIEGRTPAARKALGLLRSWNGEMSRRRPEPLLFMSWLNAFYRELLVSTHPGLEKVALAPDSGVLRNALQNRGALRCPGGDCRALLESALEKAAGGLQSGDESALVRLRWGDRHEARFPHPFSRLHDAVALILDLSIPSDGDNYTINRGGMRLSDPRAPFAHIHGPGLRAVFDLSDLDRSLFVIATGQSGNPVSPHYRDLVAEWRDGRFFRIGQSVRELDAAGAQLLVLMPR